jgi:hypothetical protein
MSPSAQRTTYTHRSTFTLSRPNNSVVTFDLSPPPNPSRPNTTRLTLPPRSTWTPSPHWHEAYTEYVQCLSGRLLVRLDGVEKVVGPEDGPQRIDRGVVHEFMRADVYGYGNKDAEGEGEDVVVEEWTDPADGVKQVFFRNLLGVLEDGEYWGGWFGVQALLICRRYDNWNVLWGGWARWAVTHAVFGVVEGVARVAGLRAWYEEYTPRELWEVAEGKGRKVR